MKEQILKIAKDLEQGSISENNAQALLLDLFDVSTRTFNVGDNVKWRGMNLIVVEVGIGEILIATSENVEDENYNDWWVGIQHVCNLGIESITMKRNKVSIGTYLYWSKNLASMLYSKLLLLFGVRHSTSVIPEGPYCYTPDYEKNKIAESFTYYVIPCKYYKTLGKRWNGCKYLGIITDDFVFNDQCKICGVNDEIDERDLS